MAELPWSGVQLLLSSVPSPLPRHRVIAAMTSAGGLLPSTARSYVRIAERLGLLVVRGEELLALAANKDAPGLLLASSLIRAMTAARHLRLTLQREGLQEGAHPLGIHTLTELRSAWRLASNASYVEPISPLPALLWTLAQVRARNLAPTQVSAWDAAEAFSTLKTLFVSPPTDPQALDPARFARACHVLHSRGLIQMVAVQFAFGAHATYQPFQGPFGYVKTLTLPQPTSPPSHAQPVPARRLRVS